MELGAQNPSSLAWYLPSPVHVGYIPSQERQVLNKSIQNDMETDQNKLTAMADWMSYHKDQKVLNLIPLCGCVTSNKKLNHSELSWPHLKAITH